MPSPRFDSATGHAAAKRAGVARKRLSLPVVEVAFGQVNTVEDAQRRLERLGVWYAAGLLAGSVGGAAIRSIEVWLKAHESELTETVVNDLRTRLDELEVQLRQSRLGVVR